MASRYELSEAQWERIKDTLPGRMEYVGRTAADEAGVASGLPDNARTGRRIRLGAYPAGRPAGAGCDRRQGLRLGRDRATIEAWARAL